MFVSFFVCAFQITRILMCGKFYPTIIDMIQSLTCSVEIWLSLVVAGLDSMREDNTGKNGK